jgi:hypothetical protein
MRKFIIILLTIIFLQNQAFSNPLGFCFIPIGEQTTLTSANKANITVGNKTTVTGAVIGSESNNLTLSTKELEYSDLKDKEVSRSKGFGIQTSIGTTKTSQQETNLAPQGSTTLSLKNMGNEKERVNKATIGEGTIIVDGSALASGSEELQGLNRDLSKTQSETKERITNALDGSVTVDNRLLLGFLMDIEVKDKDGNPVYEKNADGTNKSDENGNPIPVTINGYQSIAGDFENFDTNLAKAALGALGTIAATGKTIYDVTTNSEIGIGETAAAWKANQKTFVNQNNYDREIINSLSEGKSIEEIEGASGGTAKLYYDESDKSEAFRQRGDTDEKANYINAAQGNVTTDTEEFVWKVAHEYTHNYTENEAIAKNAGSLAGFMWGLGNALNLTSINVNGTATTTSWYQNNQNSWLLNYNTAVAGSIRQDERINLVKEISEWSAIALISGNSANGVPSYFSSRLAGFSTDFDNSLPVAQMGVDLLSAIPVLGMPFDVISFKMSEYNNDEAGMALSIIGLDPQYIGDVYTDATYWHFEGRDALNMDYSLPKTKSEMKNLIDSGNHAWQLFGEGKDIYHQYDFEDSNYLNSNNRNAKYVNITTGQEAVYDSYYNNGNLISNKLINNEQDLDIKANYINAKGTYNYITPIFPESKLSLSGVSVFFATGIGHYIVDVIPYEVGGNIRGNDPTKTTIKTNK